MVERVTECSLWLACSWVGWLHLPFLFPGTPGAVDLLGELLPGFVLMGAWLGGHWAWLCDPCNPEGRHHRYWTGLKSDAGFNYRIIKVRVLNKALFEEEMHWFVQTRTTYQHSLIQQHFEHYVFLEGDRGLNHSNSCFNYWFSLKESVRIRQEEDREQGKGLLEDWYCCGGCQSILAPLHLLWPHLSLWEGETEPQKVYLSRSRSCS